jgi:hypothetical protein
MAPESTQKRAKATMDLKVKGKLKTFSEKIRGAKTKKFFVHW